MIYENAIMASSQADERLRLQRFFFAKTPKQEGASSLGMTYMFSTQKHVSVGVYRQSKMIIPKIL